MKLDANTIAFYKFSENPTRLDLDTVFPVGGSLAPAWYTINGDPTTYTVATSGGIQINKAAQVPVGSAVAGVLSAFRLTGDFDIEVEFDGTLMQGDGAGWNSLGIEVGFSEGAQFPLSFSTTLAGIYYQRSGIAPYKRYGSYVTGFGLFDSQATAANYGRLRIERVAGPILNFYYYGSSAWVLCGTVNPITADEVVVFIGMRDMAGGSLASTGRLGHFTINSADTVYPYITDSAGNYHGLAWGGTTPFTPGVLLDSTGTPEYRLDLTIGAAQTVVPHNTVLDLATGSFTLEAWINNITGVAPTLSTVILSKCYDSAGILLGPCYGFVVDAVPNFYAFVLTDIYGAVVSPSLGAVGGIGWTHIAARLDRSSNLLCVFRDGVQVGAAVPWTTALKTKDNPFCVGFGIDGATAWGHTDNLAIDEIRISNVARTDAEIWESSRPRVPGRLAHTWSWVLGTPTYSGRSLGKLNIVKNP